MPLKAIHNSGRGNITYQLGTDGKRRPFVILRGGGTREKEVQTFIKTFGFQFQKNAGLRTVMGWRKDNCGLPEVQMILARLKHMGYTVVSAAKNKVDLPVGEWSPEDRRVKPTTASLFKLFPIVEGQNIELEELRRWLTDAGYEDVSQPPDSAGQYSVHGGAVTIWSYGTPSRLVRFELHYDTAENITQNRDGRWAKISGFRLYGK